MIPETIRVSLPLAQWLGLYIVAFVIGLIVGWRAARRK